MRIAALAAAAFATMAMAMPAAAVTVEAKVSTEFQKKLDDDLGAREAKTLTEALTRKIDNAFTRAGVKADHVVDACYLANKASVFLAVFNTGQIAFVRHGAHRLTPKSTRYSLTCLTWYGFASFAGCGL